MIKKLVVFFLLLICYNSYSLTLKISHVVKEDSPKGRAILLFKRLVEEKSQGQIKVKIYPEGSLFDDREALEALKAGLIHFAVPSFSKFADVVPEFQIYDIPYLFENIYQIHLSYTGDICRELETRSELKGFVLLAMWDNGFKVITNDVRSIIRPTDLKGLKIRTQGSKVINESLKMTGAIPIAKPFRIVVDLLKSGLIDGQQNTYNNIYTQGFFKYQKYMTITNHGFLGYAFITSKRFWDSLGLWEKSIILQVLERVTFYEYEIAKNKNFEDFYKIQLASPKIKITKLDKKLREEWENFYKKRYSVFFRYLDKHFVNKVLDLLKKEN